MASLLTFLLAHPATTARLLTLCGVVIAGIVTACLTEADLRADVRLALERSRWTLEAAAAQIGISRQRLGHQLDGTDPLTCLSRLSMLDGFWLHLVDISAPRYGLVVVRNQELADILDHLRGGR